MIGFDDNAEFHQADVFSQLDPSQEEFWEVTVGKWDLNYISFDGDISYMVNGVGFAMLMVRGLP